MSEIDIKLTLITDIWNDYFLNYKYCQRKINYNEDVSSNYYGDILYYFTDTIDFLKINQEVSDFKSSIFNSIGLLQIIYVHQDLIKELFQIFKVPQLKKGDFEPNRRIRNELVGHPIRKFKNELLSSSRYANRLTNKTICYIKYSKDDNFKGNIIEYDVDKILSSHFDLLNKSLDLIIVRQKKILKKS